MIWKKIFNRFNIFHDDFDDELDKISKEIKETQQSVETMMKELKASKKTEDVIFEDTEGANDLHDEELEKLDEELDKIEKKQNDTAFYIGLGFLVVVGMSFYIGIHSIKACVSTLFHLIISALCMLVPLQNGKALQKFFSGIVLVIQIILAIIIVWTLFHIRR